MNKGWWRSYDGKTTFESNRIRFEKDADEMLDALTQIFENCVKDNGDYEIDPVWLSKIIEKMKEK